MNGQTNDTVLLLKRIKKGLFIIEKTLLRESKIFHVWTRSSDKS